MQNHQFVLGHTSCGAVKGACDSVKMGNLTAGARDSHNHQFVDDVTELNVDLAIKTIREKSPILKELEDAGKIRIVGAIYDTSNGKVVWR